MMSKKTKAGLPPKGRTVEIFTEGDKSKSAVFFSGGGKRHMMEKDYDGANGPVGEVLVNGRVVFADKTAAWCVLQVDETSSGELCSMGIFLPDGGFAWTWEEAFLNKIGKSEDEVYPYKYKYDAAINALSNHHVGGDGWSVI